ncbi:hypothetical protein EB796_006793 [Bugula neritina]|uniref:NXF1/2/3/5-like leucine-rich repeat domain-containing protein n=1 Tax=Bugula neritina TaxID=10212 RepID=A0A7J7KAM6_BUGNE|nr:hypothetical protein EB796_006793 [Bugula neritina]
MPNGFKMMVTVRQETPPVPKVVEGALMEKLLSTMNELYNIENKVLDLSALHKHESNLKPDFLPLNRPQVMTSVVSIICEHIAQDLVALNLSNNRLSSLVHLRRLCPPPSTCRARSLNNPELRESELDRLKVWNLTEIN